MEIFFMSAESWVKSVLAHCAKDHTLGTQKLSVWNLVTSHRNLYDDLKPKEKSSTTLLIKTGQNNHI